MNIPSCRVTNSHSLRMFPHKQQQSPPWVCASNLIFQHPAPVCNSGQLIQTGLHRAVTWTTFISLILSCLPQTSCCTTLQGLEAPCLSQLNSLHGGAFFRCKNISSPSALHLQRYQSHPTNSLLPFPYSFFHPTQIQPRKHIKKQRHYFAKKGPSGQSYGFSNTHVWM